MRLLDRDGRGRLRLTDYSQEVLPPYAILSHTWGLDEVLFKDVHDELYQNKAGYRKIDFCLKQAAADGLQYCWVDTCCIDKKDAVELSEAINSMFRWYRDAEKCYVYLSDVPEESFRSSRWFTRGWTLQELLAPNIVEFFTCEGERLGTKTSLIDEIHERTQVPIAALQGKALAHFSDDEKMSWISRRRTHKDEDMVYSLLGIFDVSMPLIYGEGRPRAYFRLHKHVEEARSASFKSRDMGKEKDDVPRPLKRRRLEPEHFETILKFLRFEQIEARRLTIKAAHTTTCRWLLTDAQYTRWLDSETQGLHDGFLWIKGKPGSGKSTMMKFALENVRQAREFTVTLSFFFNARGARLEKSINGAYRTLLIQLLEEIPSLQSIFRTVLGARISRIVKDRDWKDHEWNTILLQDLLTEAVRSLEGETVVCFIDALDECDGAEVRDMIYFLDNLCQDAASSAQGRIRICFASRHYPHITIPRGLELVLDDREGHEQDIISYLSSELRLGHGKHADEIRSEVLRKASGVFIWVVLVVSILNTANDSGGKRLLRQKLTQIPDDLSRLFLDILTRDSDNLEGTKLCIQWILFAREPMNPRQLHHAVLSGIENSRELFEGFFVTDEGEWSDEEDSKFILAHSKGLAVIVRHGMNATVQFVHESVRDFLLKDKGFHKIWPDHVGESEGQSHERLKQCCLSCLDAFFDACKQPNSHASRMISAELEFLGRMRVRNHFVSYAYQSILYHSDQASKRDIRQTNFLRSFNTSHWVELADTPISRGYTWVFPDSSLLYILAASNLPNLIREYPDALEYLKVEGSGHGVPLFAALSFQNKDAVLAFLDTHVQRQQLGDHFKQILTRYSQSSDWQGYFDDQRHFPDGGSVRLFLVKNANDELYEFIQDAGFLPDDADSLSIEQAFDQASRQGHLRTVSRLISFGVNVNAPMRHYGTALNLASLSNHVDMVRLLLESGADVNAHGGSYGTAIQAASHHGNTKVAKLLFENGADINAKGGLVGTALQAASRYGRLELVRPLIDRGAKVNAAGGPEGTALQAASLGGHVTVVELLIERDADVNARAGPKGTALQAASSKGYLELVRLLLDKGADPNAQSGPDGDALRVALKGEYWDVVRLLRTRGARSASQGTDTTTPTTPDQPQVRPSTPRAPKRKWPIPNNLL